MGRVDACPGLDDGEDLGGVEVGEGEVVRGGEGQDVAFPRHGLGAQQCGRQVLSRGGFVLGLLLFDGAVVVDEDKGAVIFWVLVALGSFVAWAEITLWDRDILSSCRGKWALFPWMCMTTCIY